MTTPVVYGFPGCLLVTGSGEIGVLFVREMDKK